MNPHQGSEFDWFLIDSDGHVACCSSAGFGEIPAVFHDMLWEACPIAVMEEIIACLPRLGGYDTEGRGPGTHRDWPELGKRGIYTFDWRHWKGPYKRLIRPRVALSANDLPDQARQWMQPFRTDTLRFAETTAFQFDDLDMTPLT